MNTKTMTLYLLCHSKTKTSTLFVIIIEIIIMLHHWIHYYFTLRSSLLLLHDRSFIELFNIKRDTYIHEWELHWDHCCIIVAPPISSLEYHRDHDCIMTVYDEIRLCMLRLWLCILIHCALCQDYTYALLAPRSVATMLRLYGCDLLTRLRHQGYMQRYHCDTHLKAIVILLHTKCWNVALIRVSCTIVPCLRFWVACTHPKLQRLVRIFLCFLWWPQRDIYSGSVSLNKPTCHSENMCLLFELTWH